MNKYFWAETTNEMTCPCGNREVEGGEVRSDQIPELVDELREKGTLRITLPWISCHCGSTQGTEEITLQKMADVVDFGS